MSNIYETLVVAVREHWKAHDNRYPQKILLTAQQHHDLMALRQTGRIALGSEELPETDRFLGAALEIDDAEGGVIVAADGSRSAFSAGQG